MISELNNLALDARSSYNGQDPNLKENPRCWTCCENPGLLLCSRCKILPYCSTNCQQRHFAEHKAGCKKLDGLVRKMKAEAKNLRLCQISFMGPPENAFAKDVGSFWGLPETRDYMRARLVVVDEVERMNWDLESKRGWEMVAAHMQDMLRLSLSDNIGIRFRFPFVLINLNRDDDAACFIRYWMEDFEANPEKTSRAYARSKKGDWLYPKEDGARYWDILEQCPAEYEHKHTPLSFLMAIAIIKMRVVAALYAKQLRSDPDFDTVKYQQQKGMLHRLLDVIDKNNKTMLPALLHPDPLRDAGRVSHYSPGTPSEASMVMFQALRMWARIPGAHELLIARFGTSTPSYDTSS